MSATSAQGLPPTTGPSGLPGAAGLAGLGLPSDLPNPFTPLAFLPPDIARQTSVGSFILVASMTIMIWDILNNLRSDYLLITRRKIGLPTVVYFFSRIVNLVYQIGGVVVNTAPIGHCRTASIAVNALFPLVIPSTSLLLFFQVRAIYIQNNLIVFFFGFMWIAVVASCATTVIASTFGMNIGPTEYCAMFGELKPYFSTPAIVVLVNDTLMFVSVVYKVLKCSMAPSTGVKTGVKTFLFGTSLPALSKALLQNGQAYFLSTVGINLITVMVFYIDTIPPTYRLVMGIPDIVLMNVLACRIYRNTKLGLFRLPEVQSASSSIPHSPSSHNMTIMTRSGRTTQTVVPPMPVVINVTTQSEKQVFGNAQSRAGTPLTPNYNFMKSSLDLS